jgi:hypothetical protein
MPSRTLRHRYAFPRDRHQDSSSALASSVVSGPRFFVLVVFVDFELNASGL